MRFWGWQRTRRIGVVGRWSVAALLSILPACATVALPPPEVAERARTATTYSAVVRIAIDGSGLRARTRALVAFRRPDALRVEVPGPTGVRLIAVTYGNTLIAVFPSERAVFTGTATARDLDSLWGVALAPQEVMDLLVGVPSPRLKRFSAGWGSVLPDKVEAELPDGSRLRIRVDGAETGIELPEAAFAPPPHGGYRAVEADEARRLLSAR